jgi:mannose-1-phosphate guanylyltransferase
VVRKELARLEPEIVAATSQAVAEAKTDIGFEVLDKTSFVNAPKTSIDYAVRKQAHRGAAR